MKLQQQINPTQLDFNPIIIIIIIIKQISQKM